MTDGPVAFLRARLDEDERTAQAVRAPADWHQGPGDDDPEWVGDEMVLMWPPEFHTPYEQDKHWRGLTVEGTELAAHIARHDPARVLREVEAKRELLELHAPVPVVFGDEHSCTTCARVRGKCCATLRLLALPYADHPDYQERWRP